MARGDFRGSVGTVIQAPTVQVQNTQGAYVNFQSGSDGKQAELAQIMDAVRNIQGAAEHNFMYDLRERKQLAAEQKQEAERAEHEAKMQERQRSSWKADIEHSRYVRNMQEFIKNVPEEDLGLDVSKFNEKYKDSLPKLDLREVSDPMVSERYAAQAEYDTEAFHQARMAAYQKGRVLRDFTSLTDEEAQHPDMDIGGLILEGKSAYMKEAEIWTALTSTAQSQMALGNTQPLMKMYDYAAKSIDDPELRDKVLDTLQPMYARATHTEKAKKTVQEVIAVEKAQTFDELTAAFNNSGYEWSAEEKVSNYQRVEKLALREELKQGALGVAEATGNLAQMEYALTRPMKHEGQFGVYDLEFSQVEAQETVDAYFRQTLRESPDKAAQLVKYSTKVPSTARRAVNDLFNRALSTGELDAKGSDFAVFAMMDNAVGESRSEFIHKFGLEGDAKAIYTQYHLEKQKSIRGSSEEALQYAIQSVKQAKENGSFGDSNKAKQAIETLLEGSDTTFFSPRQRKAAEQAAQEYSLTLNPEEAAKRAVEDAKLLGVQIGKYNIDNGREFEAKLGVILQDYYKVTPEKAVSAILSDVENIDATFMDYDSKRGVLQVFDTETLRRYEYKDSEIKSLIDKEYSTYKHEYMFNRKAPNVPNTNF